MIQSILTLALCTVVNALVPSGPWDAFNYAPSSRTVWPKAVHSTVGSVSNGEQLVHNAGYATLAGNGSWIALDFGIEVGGLISFDIETASSDASLALSFTESPVFIRPGASDDSSYPSANLTYDGVFTLGISETLPVKTHWTQPTYSLRGGFRYLTLVLRGNDAATSITLSNVSCAISFMPHWDNLRAYTGYFYAKDPVYDDEDFLTKLWYAGAYTVQTNTVPLQTGRQVPFVKSPGWQNNATLGVAGPIIVDGAKRDRAVWPGDMGIAVPAQFVSTNDLLSTRNALMTMFAAMNAATGELPESGPPLSQKGSDTYHAWTLIGVRTNYIYSGDEDWLRTVWSDYTKAVGFLERKVDSSGLMNVTGLRDWARLGGGGHNAAGNALLYKVLTDASELAMTLEDTTLAQAYAKNASALKDVYQQEFWLDNAGMFRDNSSTTLCPQDANSFAVIFGLADTDQAKSISAGLTKNWNELGPIAPELPDTISPFISGFELQAHFDAGEDDIAMDLVRRTWGYMLYTNQSVQSTLLEGFTANGSLYYRGYRGYNYDAAYTSHAHGWSAGPTSALTFYVLGLNVVKSAGSLWRFVPHTSGLPCAQGGFETPLGWFGAQWWSLTDPSTRENTLNEILSLPGIPGRDILRGLAWPSAVWMAYLDVPEATAGEMSLAYIDRLDDSRATTLWVDGKIQEVVKDQTKEIPFSMVGGKHVIVCLG